MTASYIIRPAALENQIMGHIKDTEHVQEIEKRYRRALVGYDAKWTDSFRTYILEGGKWCGVFPLTSDDLEVYKKG